METCSHSGVTRSGRTRGRSAGAQPGGPPPARPRQRPVRARRQGRLRRGADLRDITAEAGVALGTVYRYFSSKERLLLEANVRQVADLGAVLLSRPPKGETPTDRVVDVLRRACHTLGAATGGDRGDGAGARLAQPSEADTVRRVSEAMTAMITAAMHEGDSSEHDRAVARVLSQVWLSSLVGWVGGVDGPQVVGNDLERAARMLI